MPKIQQQKASETLTYDLDDVRAIWCGYLQSCIDQDDTVTLGKTVIDSQVETLWEDNIQDADTVWEDGNTKVDREHIETGKWAVPTYSFDIFKTPSRDRANFGFDIYQGFKLLERIADGSMGLVLEAYQASIGRHVAIKMIRPEFACNENARAKFISEARITGNLSHPNIIPIYEICDLQDVLLFYAMKYVKGTSWKTAMREKSEAENLDILLHVCDAVSFAHSEGVIHRDLKPANVMLGDYGEILVMDWGLAVSFSAQGKTERLSRQAGASGTPAYMAPEMARRENSKIGLRSDIYLLGGILYEIVTGLRPHSADTLENCVLNAMNNRIQPSSSEGELVEIALKAMATNLEDRYATVQDFQQAIREYQAHSQSIALSSSAQQDFDRADDTKLYDDYVRSLFGFRNALKIWPENPAALRGIERVSLAYAQCAHQNGDYDLAISLLDSDLPTHASFLDQVKKARVTRNQRNTWTKIFLYGMVCLFMAIILALSTQFFSGQRSMQFVPLLAATVGFLLTLTLFLIRDKHN